MTAITDVELEAMLFVRHLTLTAQRRTNVDLDRSAYTILACLNGGGALTLAELSETLGLDTSTVSRQTTAMLASGMLQRVLDPAGGVARKLQATQIGEDRLREACAANIRVLQEATVGWPDTELGAFAEYLRRANRAFEEMEGTPWPRASMGHETKEDVPT